MTPPLVDEPPLAAEPGEGIEDLPFDQYQRYRLIAEVCSDLRGEGQQLRVLDVGGRTGVLRRFLPADRVELVDLARSDVPGLVLGAGDDLPFRSKSFDVVVAADTLEHVPPDRRESFVKECCRVASSWAILAGPYQHERVQEAEELLQGFLREKLHVEHVYLNEHRDLGLPDREAVEGWCREGGAHAVSAIGHGNIDRWLGLLSLELYMDEVAELRPLIQRLFRFYNGALYRSDRRGVVYRHAVVAVLDDDLPPPPAELVDRGDLDANSLAPFSTVLVELAAFDREREEFRSERAQYEKMLAEREGDLAGHKQVLENTLADLEEHKRTLATLRAEFEKVQGESAAIQEQFQTVLRRTRIYRKILERLDRLRGRKPPGPS